MITMDQIKNEIKRGGKYNEIAFKWLKKHNDHARLIKPMMEKLVLCYWIAFIPSMLIFVFSLPLLGYGLMSGYSLTFLFKILPLLSLISLGGAIGFVWFYATNLKNLDLLSNAIEKSVAGSIVDPIDSKRELSLGLEELRKFVACIIISVILSWTLGIILFWIPVIGGLIHTVFSFCIGGLLGGWIFFDFPLARRGVSFIGRLKFVYKNAWTVFGIAIPIMIPIMQIIYFERVFAAASTLCVRQYHRDLSNKVAVE